MRLEFLPVHRPSQEEVADPVVFAQAVQRRMADSLGIAATDIQREEFKLDRRKTE